MKQCTRRTFRKIIPQEQVDSKCTSVDLNFISINFKSACSFTVTIKHIITDFITKITPKRDITEQCAMVKFSVSKKNNPLGGKI